MFKAAAWQGESEEDTSNKEGGGANEGKTRILYLRFHACEQRTTTPGTHGMAANILILNISTRDTIPSRSHQSDLDTPPIRKH